MGSKGAGIEYFIVEWRFNRVAHLREAICNHVIHAKSII